MVRTEEHLLSRRWIRWSLIFALWTLIGLFEASQTYFLAAFVSRPMPLAQAVMLSLADWYLWGALAPFLFQLSRCAPFDHHRWETTLFLYGVATAFFALVKVALDVPVDLWLRYTFPRSKSPTELFEIFFFTRYLSYLLVCWVILGVGLTVNYYRKYRDRELRASQLTARLAEAQLQVLKMQLHPHFLFNTLNAISALMHQNVEVADRMIARLAQLLRSALDNVGTQEVALRQELDFIRPYLEIEQTRFGSRLQVQMTIEEGVLNARVPNLILQRVRPANRVAV